MAEQPGQPEKPASRWVLIKMLHHAIERTEEQIAELKAGGLWVRDASGPDDHHDTPEPAVVPRPAVQPAAPKPAA